MFGELELEVRSGGGRGGLIVSEGMDCAPQVTFEWSLPPALSQQPRDLCPFVCSLLLVCNGDCITAVDDTDFGNFH